MRRILLLLALVAAGVGSGPGGGSTVATDGPYEISARDGAQPAAFLRPGVPQLSALGPADSGPSPGPVFRRQASPHAHARLPLPLDARAAAFEARQDDHRQFAARFAMQRAGRNAFPSTAPPPFPLV